MDLSRQELEREAVEILGKNLRKSSKFHGEDLRAICAGVKQKTDDELRTTIARQRAINETSLVEIRQHQVF